MMGMIRLPWSRRTRRATLTAMAAVFTLAGAAIAAPKNGADNRTTAPAPDPTGATIVLAAAGGERKSGCIRIRRIEVRGVVLLGPDELRMRLRPLALRCVGNEDVKAILAAINEAYADRGYVTTQG